jgi:uncharacterized protein YkwD
MFYTNDRGSQGRRNRDMSLYRYATCVIVVIALTVVVFVGCGVNSGVRDGNTPKYTNGPAPGMPGGPKEPGSSAPGDVPENANEAETEVFNIINEEREKAGVGQVSWCDGLASCVRAHCCDMCDRGYFDHENPEGEGPNDRAQAGHAGSYTFDPIVPDPYMAAYWENIAWGDETAQSVMNGWMNSSGHRENILNGSHTHVGVGQCTGCRRHWGQLFGRRSGGGGGTPPSGGGGGGKG